MRDRVAGALLLAGWLLSPAALAGTGSGMSSYEAQCAVCHQRAAVGAPGQFPRLAGRVGAIAAKAEGRAYIVGVVRNGLSGSIKVDGAMIVGLMPPFPQLPADELAGILNYLTSLKPHSAGKPHRFDGAEVTKLSARVASPQQLLAERESLASAGVVP